MNRSSLAVCVIAVTSLLARSSLHVTTLWHYNDSGSGRPLILLHGIGMSHLAWDPVIPFLRATHRVIAFDVAGFGRTPPLPTCTPPNLRNLVDGLERSIRALGIDGRVDLAGNSLGGAMALEAATRGLARTALAISPPGLWRDHPPHHVKYVFSGLRFMTMNFPRVVKAGMRLAMTRELMLAVPVSAGSWRMPAVDAIRCVDDLAASSAFETTFEHTSRPFSGMNITVPVTLAFGDRDWILPRWSRRRDRLPAHANWIEKRGWGHVPMWVDPSGVAQLINESCV